MMQMMKKAFTFVRRHLKLICGLSLLVALVVSLSATGVFASLIDTTSLVKNELTPGLLRCETTADNAVKNTGNVPALVRARVLVNWVDPDTGKILAAPPEGADMELVMGDGWMGPEQDPTSDYWYCNSILEAGAVSPVLVESANGSARITILAEVIQATPASAAASAWGISFENGSWN